MSMNILEFIMMLCFGFAWPFNVVKSYKSKTATGKSILFPLVIFSGLLVGMLKKYMYGIDFIFYVNLIEALIVGSDLVLTLRNKMYDKQRAKIV